MSKKEKGLLLAIFVAVVAVVGLIAWLLNNKTTQEGTKSFMIVILSERDDFAESAEYYSGEEYLGQFLRSFNACQWEESGYGIYIKGFYDMQEDIAEQYWWNVTVNGENSTTGADEIPLNEGDVYTFQLMQGW